MNNSSRASLLFLGDKVHSSRQCNGVNQEYERLYQFNDPNCPGYIGANSWAHHEAQLELVTFEDGCAADLRGHTLEKNRWQIVTEPGLERIC